MFGTDGATETPPSGECGVSSHHKYPIDLAYFLNAMKSDDFRRQYEGKMPGSTVACGSCKTSGGTGSVPSAAATERGPPKRKLRFCNCLAYLSIAQLAKLKLPLPPIGEQRQFASFVAKVDKFEFAAKRAVEKLDLLYRSKLQEHFG